MNHKIRMFQINSHSLSCTQKTETFHVTLPSMLFFIVYTHNDDSSEEQYFSFLNSYLLLLTLLLFYSFCLKSVLFFFVIGNRKCQIVHQHTSKPKKDTMRYMI